MKNKLLIALCVAALFIPTYIAVIYYFSVQGAPIDIKAVNKMELTDTDGQTFSFVKKEGTSSKNEEHVKLDEDPIGFFMEMNAAAKSEDALPAPLVGTSCFTARYFIYDRESLFQYYFTDNPSSAYYVDDNNEAFRIGEEYASEFLLSRYALSLYPASKVPTMTVSSQELLPMSMSWRYINYRGDYAAVDAETLETYAIPTFSLVGGALNIAFDNQPDYMFVTITEGGAEIFSDVYENINSINLHENPTVNVRIDSKWYESAERGSGGEASYSFYANVTAQPAFYLGETTIEPGEFVVLTGKNVLNINDIQFSSTPDIGFTPVFYQDEKYVRALIPISYDLPEVLAMAESSQVDSISFTFTITTSGVSQVINLNVNDKKFKSQSYDIAADIVQMKRTTASLTAFEKAMANTYANSEATRYFDGVFQQGDEGNDAQVKTGFGVYRILRSVGETYRHQGVDFIVGATETVVAVNAGKVIYVGEQVLSGKMVVIDHGWGLKSTYCHLSSIRVKEGDIVSTGSELGTVGATGFTSDIRLHVGMSVFNVPVCAYPLWEEGVVMVNP